MLDYGEWRPDVGAPNSGFCQVADGVMPQQTGLSQFGQPTIGYGPFSSLVVPNGAGALSGAPRGSISITTQTGTSQVYFATASTIEQLQANYTFSSIDTGRSVTSGDDVIFAHFGSYLLNTDTTDGLKAYNVDAPAGNNAVSGAPVARFVFTCNNVVFALDCDGNNKRMQSSGVGDHTAWASLGADGKTFEDGGALIGGVDLKNGKAVIFQESAMRLIEFGAAASPALYSITKIADGRGSVGERSIVAFDGMVFFWATDGLYKFDLQNGNQPIGAEKFNRWFLANIATGDLVGVQGSLDPQNKIVCWRYRQLSNASTTTYDTMICYDWQLGRGFTLPATTSALARITTPGYTLDGMDAFGPLDSLTVPLDDRFWQGGAPLYGALNANFKFATFSGTNMAATLQTFVTSAQQSTRITGASPISNSANSTLQVGVSDKLSDAITWKTASTKSRAGKVDLRGRGFNFAFRENIPAADVWSFATGIDGIITSAGGSR